MPVKGNKKADRRYYFTNHEIYYADRTIARFIWQILKRYKKKERVHYPGWDEADTPEEWEDLLNEFIWTFDQIARGGPDSPVRKCMANYKDEVEYKKVMKVGKKRRPTRKELETICSPLPSSLMSFGIWKIRVSDHEARQKTPAHFEMGWRKTKSFG